MTVTGTVTGTVTFFRSGWGKNELRFPAVEILPANGIQIAQAAKHTKGHIVVAHEQVQGEAGDNLHHLDNGDTLGIVEAEVPAVSRIVVGEAYLIHRPIQFISGTAMMV